MGFLKQDDIGQRSVSAIILKQGKTKFNDLSSLEHGKHQNRG
jgi:hypothetical protein